MKSAELGSRLGPGRAAKSSPLPRDRKLDLLRGAAVLYIVCVWHLDDYIPGLDFQNSATTLLTTCVLGLFMFLSGLLLSRRYTISCRYDVGRFYVRRMCRIYPMYFATVAAFCLAGLTSPTMAAKGLVWLNVVTASPPPTLWFVEVIFWFYMLTPLLLYRRNQRFTLLIGGVLTAALLVGSHLSDGAIDSRLPQYLPVFVLGIVAGRVAWPPLGRGRWLLLAGSASLLVCVWCAGSHFSAKSLALVLNWAGILASLPLFYAGATCVASRVPVRAVSVLSYCSFGAYLVHRLVFEAATALWLPPLWWAALLYLLGVVPVIYLLAAAFQWSSDRLTGALFVPPAHRAPRGR